MLRCLIASLTYDRSKDETSDFPRFTRKKKSEDSNPSKSWRTEHLDSKLWPQWLFDSVNICDIYYPKAHCRCIPDLHAYFPGYESITLVLFSFYVWIPTSSIRKILQHTQRVPVKLESCRRAFLEGADPSERPSTLCPSFAKLSGSVIIIFKVNYILCHVISQLTKQP